LDYLEGFFEVDTFNRTAVTSAIGQHLKYTRDTSRVHLKYKPRYEHPLVIPEREWKAIIDDAKEKKLRKEGKSPIGPAR
jgi:hypothetical protein